jgi:hypothetical protein
MPEIVLTEEQAQVVLEAGESVSVRDPQGDIIVLIDPLDVAALRRYRERRWNSTPTITWAKLRKHMQALETEWERTGGFDETYAREFVEKLRQQDES